MANLIIKSSADNLVLQGSDASPALTVAADGQTTFAENATLSGTLGVTGNTTLSGTANNLGTVTAGTIATGVHGKYVLEDHDKFYYATLTSTTSLSQDAVNISGSSYVTMATGASTSDLLTFEMNFGEMHQTAAGTYSGAGFQVATNSGFSSGVAIPWRTGQHTFGGYNGAADRYMGYISITKTRTVAEWGLAANTTYYFRLIGQTHSVAGTFGWGKSSTNSANSTGVKLSCFKWRLV
jgi:hypothetical protein